MVSIGQTLSGYKVSFVPGGKNDADKSFLDRVDDLSDFISNSQSEGVWYALTGEHFKESLIQFGKDMLDMVIQCSDLLVIAVMVFGIGAIAGSGFCKKWMYYVTIAYIFLKCLGSYVL